MIPAFRMPALRICALLLAVGVGTLVSGGQTASEEARSSQPALARELVEEVSAGPGVEPLDAWSRSVVERALERAGTDAEPASGEPAANSPPVLQRHTGTDGAKGAATVEVLLFTSLAVPAASWRASARDAARIGAPLVLRGVGGGSLPATARQITTRLGGAEVGVAIDPRLFRLFGIERVPAVVVVPGGVPRCRSRGCADDAPPPFDRVTGNLSLAAALEAVAAEGGAARATARRHLATLRRAER